MKVTTYKQAFEGILGVSFNEKIKEKLTHIEKVGYYEKGICFAIWKSQDKLMKFKQDPRFWSILLNEVRKHCWTRDDPRLKMAMIQKQNR